MRLFRAGRDPWFILPVAFAMLLDAGATLACQPATYWADPAALQEGNPAWEALLAAGPAAFAAGFLAYGLVMAALLAWVAGALQKLLGAFVLLAHTYGAASWCHAHLAERAYWWALLGVLLAEAVVFAVYWRLSPLCGERAGPEGGPSEPARRESGP